MYSFIKENPRRTCSISCNEHLVNYEYTIVITVRISRLKKELQIDFTKSSIYPMHAYFNYKIMSS
jgi:hypothetical protein